MCAVAPSNVYTSCVTSGWCTANNQDMQATLKSDANGNQYYRVNTRDATDTYHQCQIVPDGIPEVTAAPNFQCSAKEANRAIYATQAYSEIVFIVDFEDAAQYLKDLSGGVKILYLHIFWADVAGNQKYTRHSFEIIIQQDVVPFEAFQIPNPFYGHYIDFSYPASVLTPHADLGAQVDPQFYGPVMHNIITHHGWTSGQKMNQDDQVADGSISYEPVKILEYGAENGAADNIFVGYNTTKFTNPNNFFEEIIHVELNRPTPESASDQFPCVAELRYITPRGGHVFSMEGLNYAVESYTPRSKWIVHLDYNNITCPYKLAVMDFTGVSDWSVLCQLNNTCYAQQPADPHDCILLRDSSLLSCVEVAGS